MNEEKGASRNQTELRIPFRTYVQLFVAALVGYCGYLLWPFLLLLFLAVLLAVSLNPLVEFLESHRWPRWLAISSVTLALFSILSGAIVGLLPPLADQFQAVSTNLPALKEKIVTQIPSSWGGRGLLEKNLKNPLSDEKAIQRILLAGESVAGAISGVILLLILSLYLLVDGKRTYEWLLAYLSTDHRKKMDETAKAVSKVIFSYVAGQVITSLLATVFTFIVLTLLKVPAALVLSLLAGALDVVPIVGFFLTLVPAVLLALTVSPSAALAVTGLYLFYHAVENYLIVPKIYGNRMRVSGLVVLITLVIAGSVAGVLGAIVVLPIAASYPIIERIWLEKYVGKKAVAEHQSA